MRLEHQQALDVQRPLIVEQAARPADDELRQHHDHLGPAVIGELVDVSAERRADVAVRRTDDLERNPRLPPRPLVPHRLPLVVAEREMDRLRVVDSERARIVHRPHRRGIHRGDEHADDGVLRRRLVRAGERRHVGDDDARLCEQAPLEQCLARMPERLEEARTAEPLRDDHGDEARLAARQPPHLLDDRLRNAQGVVQHLEVRALVRESEPARLYSRVSRARGDVDRAEAVFARVLGEPERVHRRLVDRLDEQDRLVVRRRRREDRIGAGAQSPLDPAVVAADPVGTEHEQRDCNRHEPGAGGELRDDYDHRDEAGRGGADGVDGGAVVPTRVADAAPVADHAGLRERERSEDADHVQVDQRVDVRAVNPDQQPRQRREDEHPVREDEPVAEVRELARREVIARHQRGEPRKALEGGVGGEDEDQERRCLDDVVHEARSRSGRERRARDLRDHRRRLARHRVLVHGQVGDAEEEGDRDHAKHRERPRSVTPVRATERVDAVRNRLDPGQRGRAGRERA